jgi:ABC-type glycerol-3-phosphate transport system substrate-binding protein
MTKTLLASLVAAAVLAACGGGDDNAAAPPPTSEVPASASASASGFIAYLQLLVASMADTLEPVDTSAVTPPADDTGEPLRVD